MSSHKLLFSLSVCAALLTAAPPASEQPSVKEGLLYVGCWPNKILVIDEAKEQVVDTITLQTGVARTLTLTPDRQRLIVTTVKDSGIEVVDLATRKVTQSFALSQGNKNYRINGVTIGPDGNTLYTVLTAAVKEIDRFKMEKPQFALVDLAQGKIVRTVEFPEKEVAQGMRGQYRLSPDGKYLYFFRNNVLVFDTSDFKLVDTIELSKPVYPGMETIFLGGGGGYDDPHERPGFMTSVFNATDPIVHRRMFGIADFDLDKRTFEFTPVGPTADGMLGLRVTPDRKIGYTVAINGTHGNRVTEFWVFDMPTRRLINKMVFQGRTRFNFTVSSNGKRLYIYGAGNTLEVYDAATLKLRKELDVNADMTTSMVVVPGQPAAAVPKTVAKKGE